MLYQKLIFTEDECKKIINMHYENLNPYYAENENRKGVKYIAYPINPSVEGKWIFNRLKNFFIEHTNIDIVRSPEKMYLHHYNINDGFKKHWDKNKPEREWNVGIQLNSNFTGGDFNLFYDEKITIDKTKGNSYIFKSEVFHEVTPITEGERWALIMFLHYEHINQNPKKSLL